ncbi:MAG: monofunctional biosynthetic peptidoglycan transglycosylase [Alphaproteobacteria bacterium]|nr:monofunctional biosynthetic peptidoglycan transglycosylase [Alphaproteobacteria bacterium]
MSEAERLSDVPPRRLAWRRVVRHAWFAVYGLLVLLPIALLAIYRYVPPPVTPLMLIRLVEGEGLAKDWTPLDDIGRAAPRSVIAAEDNLYCGHLGFDWNALNKVLDEADDGRSRRGGSTISQQTAKNLFLWPGRSYVRKALEAYFTVLLELSLDKRRILELYMNIAEWGPGIYGVEAAAQHYFKKPAAKLSPREAGLLAAVLPNPRKLSAGAPGAKTSRKADTIRRRTDQLGALYDCVPEIAWTKNPSPEAQE